MWFLVTVLESLRDTPLPFPAILRIHWSRQFPRTVRSEYYIILGVGQRNGGVNISSTSNQTNFGNSNRRNTSRWRQEPWKGYHNLCTHRVVHTSNYHGSMNGASLLIY